MQEASFDDPNAWLPYRYVPSKVAAIIFVVLFSLTTALHIFQLFKKRTWYFVPLIIGGVCMSALSIFFRLLTDPVGADTP
jgi:hypothetical protein